MSTFNIEAAIEAELERKAILEKQLYDIREERDKLLNENMNLEIEIERKSFSMIYILHLYSIISLS